MYRLIDENISKIFGKSEIRGWVHKCRITQNCQTTAPRTARPQHPELPDHSTITIYRYIRFINAYCRTSLVRTPWDGQLLSLIERCPDYRGQIE
jgi:hypothetical protein